MKKLILALLIFLGSSLPVKADDPLVLNPIIDHLRLAMEDDKELEYSLKLFFFCIPNILLKDQLLSEIL